MVVKSSNGMFRCDDSCCKTFSSFELDFGGAVGKVNLCDKHFVEMLKESKSLVKQIVKNNTQNN